MSGSPILIAAGRTPTPTDPGPVEASTSEWFERTQYYAEQAVANAERGERERVEKRLAKPSQAWTKPEFMRSYRANSDGDRRFREEADVLSVRQYVGWLETGLAGEPLGARLLVGTSLTSFARRDRWHRSPNLTVTWTRQPTHAVEEGS